jgi:hypothetical protein
MIKEIVPEYSFVPDKDKVPTKGQFHVVAGND